jgi:hypothetical protein
MKRCVYIWECCLPIAFRIWFKAWVAKPKGEDKIFFIIRLKLGQMPKTYVRFEVSKETLQSYMNDIDVDPYTLLTEKSISPMEVYESDTPLQGEEAPIIYPANSLPKELTDPFRTDDFLQEEDLLNREVIRRVFDISNF